MAVGVDREPVVGDGTIGTAYRGVDGGSPGLIKAMAGVVMAGVGLMILGYYCLNNPLSISCCL